MSFAGWVPACANVFCVMGSADDVEYGHVCLLLELPMYVLTVIQSLTRSHVILDKGMALVYLLRRIGWYFTQRGMMEG
jgi:hypothetical protein